MYSLFRFFFFEKIFFLIQKQLESSEPFYTISVDIKEKKDLKEALNSFVGGELLEGESAYLCSDCKKKVRALKRTSIKRLSPTLIIHLKRFEYVVERQAHRKLSDYFEFPIELDVQPYTKEGLIFNEKGTRDDLKDPSFYKYELVGILVHSGHADSGHYYSFIKERSESDPRNAKWFKFDDTSVSLFDIKNIGDECFGGSTQTSNHWHTQEHVKLKNAYMLFYEQIEKPKQQNKLQIPKFFLKKLLKKMLNW